MKRKRKLLAALRARTTHVVRLGSVSAGRYRDESAAGVRQCHPQPRGEGRDVLQTLALEHRAAGSFADRVEHFEIVVP